MKVLLLTFILLLSLSAQAQTGIRSTSKHLTRTFIIGGSTMILGAALNFQDPYYDFKKSLTQQSPRFYIITGGATLVTTGLITMLCTKKRK